MQRSLVCLCAVAALIASGCSTSLDDLAVPAGGSSSPPSATTDEAEVEPTPTAAPAPTSTSAPTRAGTDAEELTPVVLRMAVQSEPSLDPVTASVVTPTDMVVVDLLYDGLTRWDPSTHTWAPSLATALEPAADGLSWTISLREATFSDGSPLVAADVQRSLERALDHGPALVATRLEMVEAITVVDSATLVITLNEPFALLPALLSSPIYGIVPTGTLDGTVGSGPLVLAGPTELRPRPGLHLGSGGVDLVAVADDDDALALRDTGALDLAFVGVGYVGPTDLAVASTIEAHYVLNAGSFALIDPAVRAQVVDAVGRSALRDAAFGEAAVAIDRLVPDLLVCADPCGGGIEPGRLVVSDLSVAYVSDASGREAAMASALVRELDAAGITAVATGYDLETFVARVAAGSDDVIRVGWVGLFPSPDSQLAPYGSASSDNVSAFASDDFDALLAEARRGGDTAAYAEAQAQLAEQAVVIPVARLQIRALVGDNVHGLDLRHDGTFDIAALRLEAQPS